MNANPLDKPVTSRIAYRRRHGQAGQSAIIAVIVLFLLLFLATIFIAIVKRNMDNTRNAANTSASRRFADAGLNYLDKQFMEAPEGADWRPVPDCLPLVPCANVSETDPDYRYLKPYDPQTGEGGYTRVNFGSENGGGQNSSATVGGRALIRVTYQPNSTDPLSRYIKIEAIGRVGQINPLDPTTYANTEGISQRVELVAYKAIGLNEYARLVTNRDNKPVSVGLGAPFDVRDRGQLRPVPTTINGPVRVNAGLTFYGTNYISLNPYRGDALEVSGPITLNNVANNVGQVTANDPTRVYISTPALGANDINPGFRSPNVLPSESGAFTTLGPQLAQAAQTAGNPLNGLGLVRDNPRGAETTALTPEVDANSNTYQNLRSTPRLAVPTIDAPTGPGGLTRYRQLTRESAPLTPDQVTPSNPIGAGIQANAGTFGWGQGLYLPNTNDTQAASASLFSGYSVRSDWLNPASGSQPSPRAFWKGDLQYVPPAVTIELSPRYIKMTRSSYDNANGQQAFSFRDSTGGRLRNIETVVRYTGFANGPLAPKPATAVTGINQAQEFQGYPADNYGPDRVPRTNDDTAYYEGDFVIFAEGNVRIKGVVGGLDAQTQQYFKRHLTVVSNGTIYVDGNLLRDNVAAGANGTAKAVQGQSTIALLAKQYIAVNTTQFLSPSSPAFANLVAESSTDASGQALSDNPEEPRSLNLTVREPRLLLSPSFAPLLDPRTGFVLPTYVTDTRAVVRPSLFLRHRTGGVSRGAAVNIGLFNYTTSALEYMTFGPDFSVFNSPVSLALNRFTDTTNPNASTQGAAYLNERFDLPAASINLSSAAPDNLIQISQDPVPEYENAYQLSRFGIAPLDIRIEAMMYAQEGSFFIIPGPWFNANSNDTYEHYNALVDDPNTPGQQIVFGHRYGEVPAIDPTTGTANTRRRVNGLYPFYKEPQDIRITFCGSITENLPAEIADQGAWMEKWGWVPGNYGSTGLTERAGFPDEGNAIPTAHGIVSDPNNRGNGIVYEFDERAVAPYAPVYSAGNGMETVGGLSQQRPLRRNPYNPYQPLPFAPRLPVSPGFLYYGQPTDR